MGVAYNPKIVTDGLFFYYDFTNKDKSWGIKPSVNLAPYTDYSHRNYNTVYDIGGWGGDDADVIYYASGGYNDLPYKKMTKHTGGTGGSFIDEHQFMTLEEGKSYTVSCYMKASANVTVSGHVLALNRSSDNGYRVPNDFSLTTNWELKSWTYNCAVGEGGNTYQLRQIVYNDTGLPIDIYWSGLQVQEGTSVTSVVPGMRNSAQTVKDIVGNRTVSMTGQLSMGTNRISFPNLNNAYLSVAPATDFRMGTNNFTISMWVKQQDNGTNCLVESRGGSPSLAGYFWVLNYPATGRMSVFLNYGGNQYPFNSTKSDIATNVIQNLTIVVDRNLSKIDMYINGDLWDTVSITHSASISPTSGDLYYIGYDKGGGTQNYDLFCHMHYNRALSSAEVKQNFNATRGRYGV